MTDIILHHYDTSPYAEKVRTGLGLKGLAWASVELPQIMPKPNLTALTGGYRKTPVLQIGADIYCDSQLIMRELERRYPTPSFYPAGRGAADALAWWAEKTMFLPAVSIVFAKRPEVLPEGFLEDRVKFSGRNIDPVVMMAAVPNHLDQLRAHAKPLTCALHHRTTGRGLPTHEERNPDDALVPDDRDFCRRAIFQHVQQRRDGCGRKVHVRHCDAGLVQDFAERHVDRFKGWQPALPIGDGQRRDL